MGLYAVRISYINKCCKRQKCVVVGFPHIATIWCPWPRILFPGQRCGSRHTWSGLTEGSRMSQEQTENDNVLVVTEDNRSGDETADPEVDIHLPRGPDPTPGSVPQTAQVDLETVGAATPDPGLHRQYGSKSGAKSKRLIYELPMTGTWPVTDFRDPQRADLEDTVAQNEICTLKLALPGPSTSATWGPPARPRPAASTTTNVPMFSGVTSWDQYRQAFDAIVRSNGWDDATVALQLLSHLEGDTLNVTLLVPEAQRATRIGLVSAVTDHYGSPGRLADYRRQFEKTGRQDGEDPSIFAIELETLAVKAGLLPDIYIYPSRVSPETLWIR